jgi:hypothetical protein
MDMDMWSWLILAEARCYCDLVSDCIRVQDPTMMVSVAIIVYRIIVVLYTVLPARVVIPLIAVMRSMDYPAGSSMSQKRQWW